MTHSEYVSILKKAAVTTGKKVLIAAVAKRLPFLFVPVVGAVVSILLGKLVDFLIQETEFAMYFKYIDLRVDSQGREFSEAAILNHKAQQTGSPIEKAKSEKELMEKFKSFVILKS